jgi:ADP-ribosyl-[dinitrogen reductase] hydrolase
MNLVDRMRGCLLGGALGDAMGAPFEGQEGPLVVELPRRAACTDDTQLTLATCEAIVARRCVDLDAIASSYVAWFGAGRLHGVGAGTLKALRDLAAGAHWALAGVRGEFAAGSGAAMRAAPLAFLLDPAAPADRIVIRDFSRMTHHSDEAYAGALAVIAAIRAIVSGAWPGTRSLLELTAEVVPDSTVRDRLEAMASSREPAQELAARFGASGYVAESVPLALFVAQEIASRPFIEVLTTAISVGGDTDTIASMACQVAGTHVGAATLPAELLSRVDALAEIEAVVDAFAGVACPS